MTAKYISKRGPQQRACWFCECSCGNTVEVFLGNLVRGHTRSCGCLYKDTNRLAFGESACNALFEQYKVSARKRGHIFNLSLGFFKSITTQNCHYCNVKPQQYYTRPRAYGEYCYNGIDRVDNSLGYEEGNVVPCCKICNKAKLSLTYKEFIEWLDRVVLYRQTI